MADVFISYARSSAPQAQVLAKALREQDYSVWFDEDLPSHRAYAEVIEEQLKAAKVVVVIWSAEAARSQWVRAEANRGREEQKLVQMTIDGAALPLPFDQIQCANLRGWTGEGLHAGWSKVLAGIAQLVSGSAEGGQAAAATTVETLLAVLPFDAAPNDAETQSIAEGISEEVLQSLVSAGDLKVIGRTASFRFRGEAKAGAAQALGATHVVDGALRRAGARARISIQLTEVGGGAALWGERLERDVTDVFSLQDEVAALVATAVRGALTAVPSPAAPSIHSPPKEGERRHVTVVVCSLAETERLSGLDPERWRAIALRFQQEAAAAAARLDGHVVRSRRGGLEIYFGYPEAREDAAERAVRTGLAIVEAMAAAEGASASEARLKVRIGVHAGTVVVAPGDGSEVDIFGDAPRIAAAIEATAAPNSVMMSEVVHELTSGLFVVAETGERHLEGVDAPIRLFRAFRPGLVGDRSRGFVSTASSQFVGREDELQLLTSRWRRVRDGEGQAVLIQGDAGMGKTRLIQEFRLRIKADPHVWAECAGAPLFVSTPFHAVSHMLEQALGWGSEDGGDDRIPRLEQALAAAGLKVNEALPLVAEMLGVPLPDDYPPPMFPPDQRRSRLLAALTAWVFSGTRSQPLIILMEDLQWVDPSTMELLQTLVDQVAGAPLLLLLTARSEFRTPWPPRAHLAQISLTRLKDEQIRALIESVTPTGALDRDLLRSVVKRADGVPLFAEELARLVSDGHGGDRAIPLSLRDSLSARLDRLGRAKETAQLAAVLGREFSYELIVAVARTSEAQLQNDLARLTEAEVIVARGLPPYANYMFKHTLMQDAAYDALLKSRRRELHGAAAQTILDSFKALARSQPEVLARHWTEAGEAGPAITAWKDAGDAAYARRAFKESEDAYCRALALLAEMTEGSERDAAELDLTSLLTRVLALTRGYAGAETVQMAARARALAEKSGSLSKLIREEGRIWQATVTAGDYAGAAVMADHILDLAHGEGDKPSRLIFAHNAQLQTRFYTGDLAGVEEHFALMSPLIDQAGDRQAPGNNVISIGVASLSAWVLGRTTLAHERAARATAMAERSQNPYDMAMTLHFLGILHACGDDPEGAGRAAGRLLAIAEENGLSYAADLARGVLGWATARRGASTEGLGLMHRSKTEGSGARVGHTFGLTLAAQVQALAGHPDAAAETFETALVFNPQERVFRPYTLGKRGEFRLSRGEAGLAEEDFRAALALAREMAAPAWELRAAIQLAGLLAELGDVAAAARLLNPYLAAETFDDPALYKARSVFETLPQRRESSRV